MERYRCTYSINYAQYCISNDQFPCLELTTLATHTKKRDDHQVRFQGGDADAPHYVERTLDEAYFPGLSPKELTERNSDQIVSHKADGDNWPAATKPIIVVPQLWLWRFGNVVISAHESDRLSENLKNEDEFKNHLNQCHPEIQLGLILARYIRAFGDEVSFEGDDVSFESDDVSSEGDDQRVKTVDPPLARFENQVVSILTEVEQYIKDTNRSKITYDKERRFHHELSDCRSELAMLDYIVTQQQEILDSLLEDCDAKQFMNRRFRDSIGVDWSPIFEAQKLLARYRRTIAKIDGDAGRIEKNVDDLLNLKRTYASVQDSHASVLLSVAAIAFAIVTIVFAPLAFLVGLFALDMQGFNKLRVREDSSGENDGDLGYDSGKMAGIFGKHSSPLQQSTEA